MLCSSLQLLFKIFFAPVNTTQVILEVQTETLVGPHVKCPLFFRNLTNTEMFYAYR